MSKNITFDVVVAGGSVSGLLCAREIARSGLSVVVLEEDSEIGTPEHCGGLVSLKAMEKLGILPSSRSILHNINKAQLLSHSKDFELRVQSDKLVVMDRREFDKQLAFQTQKFGAYIFTKTLVMSINYDSIDRRFKIKTNNGLFSSNFFVDARGISSLIKTQNRSGILQSAQYEIYADWISSDSIIVKFDSEKYPQFFAWVIPIAKGKAKIGVAGSKINTIQTLDSFISTFGSKYSTIRKIYAPIWVGGPLKNFVNEFSLVVGDAAGQTKPTTAGGIFSCGMGGVLAGKSISEFKKTNDKDDLNQYQKKWYSIFGKEFQQMLFFRKILERLDNKSLDEIFSLVSNIDLNEISKSASFDFHSMAISRLLGTKKTMRLLSTMLGNEIRHILPTRSPYT
ncbi:MAG: NAD(P)/FAD-dependent oxidoreductase [Nitrososphaeraceae archaeon]|nr:NAD(P)/FAD-dependent oxidoreductase [Nitrososphaeraceae archaeon]